MSKRTIWNVAIQLWENLPQVEREGDFVVHTHNRCPITVASCNIPTTETPNKAMESTTKAPGSSRTDKQLSVNSDMLLQDSDGRKSHACNQNASETFGQLNLIQAAARHRLPFLQDFDLMIEQTDVPRYLKKHEATLKFPEKVRFRGKRRRLATTQTSMCELHLNSLTNFVSSSSFCY